MRQIVEGDLPGVCRWLGVRREGAPQVLSSNFPAVTLSADLVARVGPRRLLHVEYVGRPAADLRDRMALYWALLRREHPGHRVLQFVIVMGRGTVRDAPEVGVSFPDLQVIYLRDVDPERFLRTPGAGLAPLAVLARGADHERVRTLGAAVRVIRRDGGVRSGELFQLATGLARIALDRPTIEAIAKEAGMTLRELADQLAEFYKDSYVGEIVKERSRELGLEEGREQGLEEGREQGREQGRAGVLIAVLRSRFGDHPDNDEVAHRLAGWDPALAVTAITSAAAPSDLLDADPPG
jgi:hypothetical protein